MVDGKIFKTAKRLPKGKHPKMWWRLVRNTLVDEFEESNFEEYFRAYGWAEGAFQPLEQGDMNAFVEDAASFYSNLDYVKEFDEYRVNVLMHLPMVSYPTWPDVVNHLQVLFTTPAELPAYLGLRRAETHDDKNHTRNGVCRFILKLLHKRNIQEAQGKLPSWGRREKWAAAHVLYRVLGYAHSSWGKQFTLEHPTEYKEEVLKAMEFGEVNKVLCKDTSDAALSQEQARLVVESRGLFKSVGKLNPRT